MNVQKTIVDFYARYWPQGVKIRLLVEYGNGSQKFCVKLRGTRDYDEWYYAASTSELRWQRHHRASWADIRFAWGMGLLFAAWYWCQSLAWSH